MIGFSAIENGLTGMLDVLYSGNELEYQKVIVKWETILLSLDGYSNPLVRDFLERKSKIELNIETGGVFNIELFFLQGNNSIYTIEDNKLIGNGVYAEYLGWDYIYTDKPYCIDKTISTANVLYTDSLITHGEVFKAKVLRKPLIIMRDIKKEAVHKTMNYSALTNKEKDRLNQIIQVVRLLETDINFESKKELFYDLTRTNKALR